MPSHNGDTPIIVGCGFLGTYLAKQLQSLQQLPLCIVHSKQSHSTLSASGLNAHIFNLDKPGSALKFELSNKCIYYLAPPSNRDECDHRIDNFLALCKASPPKKIVYISTSGVYGDCAGQWVDETQPVAPISDRAKRRVYAENVLMDFCHSYPTSYVILRVGGIYGPGRLPINRLDNITVVCPEEARY